MTIPKSYQQINYPDGSVYLKLEKKVGSNTFNETIKSKTGAVINKTRVAHEKTMRDKNKGKVIIRENGVETLVNKDV